MRRLVTVLLPVAAACGGSTAESDARPGPDGAAMACRVPPTAPPAELALDPFYTKYLDAGLPVIASARVSDAALAVACEIVSHMVADRPDVRARLVANRIRVGVMAESEVTTDMPEHSDLDEAFPGIDWDTRARGLGATLARPLTSCGEENLLALASDRYRGESILVHELGHTVWDLGVRDLPGGEDRQAALEAAYQGALAAGTYAGTYAATNVQEYWAEGVQDWWNTNLSADPPDGIHNRIDTRAELRAADPALAALAAQVFADSDWQPPPYPP